MKKIIALVGSQAGIKSNTKLLCEKLIEVIGTIFSENIAAEIITSDSWKLRSCCSCSTCFNKGYCPQDKLDHMGVLKEKILNSDIVVFASPVYACNVSGDMKTLLDRLSLWLHTMPLIGKIGIPLCTASYNHTDRVIDYLSDMLEDMGAAVPAAVRAYRHSGELLLKDKDKLTDYLRIQSELVYHWYSHQPSYSKVQDVRYKVLYKKYAKQNEFRLLYPELSDNLNEARLWYEQGYHQCKTIYDACLSISKNSSNTAY